MNRSTAIRALIFIATTGLVVGYSLVDLHAGSAQQTTSAAQVSVANGTLPKVSPDGRYITFVSNRGGVPDLFVVSIDGTKEVQLTRTPEHESPAGWSRNGKVLFSVTSNDTSSLFGIDRGGKNHGMIAKVAGRAPILSPNGKRLLYMAGTWTATQVMTSALDGSDTKQLTDGSSIAWNLQWSPDGKRIAFTGRSAPQSELAVFVMNADGSGQRQVTNIAADEGGAQLPAWSPDGRRLAIQVNNRKQKNWSHIWIVDIATGNAHKLGPHDLPYLDETPSWFPDGKRLAFQSNRSGRMEVWVMNVDGSGRRQITGLAAK